MEFIEPKTFKGPNVCFIAGTLGVGGAERQLYLMIKTLKQLGSKVSLISLTSGEHWEEPVKQTGVDYFTLGGKGGKIVRLFRIISILSKIKPKIIHSQHYYTNIYAAVAGWLLNIVSIGSSRSDLEIEIKRNGIFGLPSFRWPSVLILNSMKSFEYAMVLGRNRSSIYYLPNALDTDKFNIPGSRMDSKKDQFVLIAMGRQDPPKRFDKFIELIARLKQISFNKIRIKGILIGTGVSGEDLRQYSKNLGLDDNDLEFIQHTSEPEIYLKKADAFILTSEFEGTPNVVLEAMASGLPVFATKVGNLPFIIKDGYNGFFFDGSVENLSDMIISCLEKPDKLNSISENARKHIEENFSLDVLGTNLLYIYNKILNQA